MRIFLLIFSAGLIFPGCALLPSSPNRKKEPSASQTSAPIVQSIQSASGRVAKANLKFMVLTFPFGDVPGTGQRLNVYRDGKKVAELKITGPQRDINTVADIISGDAREGDEVRRD